jgi:endonuclease-3 related protein
LYAGNKLTFVVDAYTVRICQRVPLIKSGKYNVVKKYFEKNVEPDVLVYNEFHALFVALGKNYCKNKKPECQKCPLAGLCEFSKMAAR